MTSEKFCGEALSSDQLGDITDIVSTFPNLTRTELANTICELLAWKRPTGKLKTIECLQFLERLDDKGVITLPACRVQQPKQNKPNITRTQQTASQPVFSAKLKELAPLLLQRVVTHSQRQIWYEYVDRYHYLGYRIPFGAHIRYFIESASRREKLGCLQFSSPAWRMAPRDEWIGWDDDQRQKNLQRIVNNSRFLIFPWVQVKNLASSVLALAARTVPDDWLATYSCRPVLMETLVDQKRFAGTCYKATNWVYVGQTTGRGRMDRQNQRQGAAVKEIFLYPLSKRFRQELMKP
jgi:hypothetical protein